MKSHLSCGPRAMPLRSYALLPAAACLSLLFLGCAGLAPAVRNEPPGASKSSQTPEELARRIESLTSELKTSSAQAAKARAEVAECRDMHELEIQVLNQRLEAALAARERAIREVVTLRSRLQGMADQAQVAAMFAEARVIIDRMEEESFSLPSEQMVAEARGYLENGKKTMDEGKTGGAAYYFELVSELYQDFRQKSDPRSLTVVSATVTLRASPSPTSGKIGVLSRGDLVRGLQKSGEWVLVKAPSGLEGWLRKESVR